MELTHGFSLKFEQIKNYQMKIGVIGTGAIGGIIAKKMVKAGHTVKISNSKQGAELNA